MSSISRRCARRFSLCHSALARGSACVARQMRSDGTTTCRRLSFKK